MSGDRYAEEEDVALSMAPLIDCVFLLLIFFLVTTMLKKDLKEVEHLSLPVSRSSLELAPDEDMLAIAIDSEADIYLEGELASLEQLLDKLRTVEQEEPDRRIRLDTDEDTPIYRMVEVLDALSFRNLNNVGVRTYHEQYDE
jgi:biopolymer transport protein ExbD